MRLDALSTISLRIAIASGGIAALSGLYVVQVRSQAAASAEPAVVSRPVEVADHLLDASFFRLAVTDFGLPSDSGFPKLAMVGSRLLAATSAGVLYFVDTSAPFVMPGAGQPERPFAPAPVEKLDLRIPTDMDLFEASKITKFISFGVGDIEVGTRPDGFHDLYASFGKVIANDCMVLRVAVAEAFDRPGETASWRTVFDSQPCFKMAHPADRIAGRMRLRDGSLYLTVGYNSLDEAYFGAGRPTEENPQRDDNSYGKILRIDLATGASEIVSKGHRNPQGLYIDREGRIFETEHGPRGGDELNLIVKGNNYGFPVVTYGAAYGHHYWPVAAAQNRHEGYAKPIYAWVPSIGISQIVGMEDEGFGAWRGDFLIASLIGEKLYRVHLEDGRVVVAEPIELHRRLRDLVLDRDTIYLSTDDARIIRIRLVGEPVT